MRCIIHNFPQEKRKLQLVLQQFSIEIINPTVMSVLILRNSNNMLHTKEFISISPHIEMWDFMDKSHNHSMIT